MTRRRHPPEFKAKILAAKDAGANVKDLGKKYGVAPNQIYKWAITDATKKVVAAKGHRMRAAKRTMKRNPAETDVDRIVTELLSSMRPSLVKVIGKLVDLGVERKLDETRATVMNALRRAS